MKTRLLLVLSCALGLAACRQEPAETAAPAEYDRFGAAVTPEGALPVAEVASAPARFVGREVKLEGTVREVCRNKGCWMTLDGGEGRSVRVTFRDYGFFVPKDLSGRRVVLAGTLAQDTLGVDERRHLAEDAGRPAEEVRAITEPELTLAVVADGVLAEKPAATSGPES